MKYTFDQLEAIQMAAEFSACAHNEQCRKGGNGVPYFAHPAFVAVIAAAEGLSHKAVITEFLHDVPEDCGEEWSEKCRNLILYEMPLPVEERVEIIKMIGGMTKDMRVTPRALRNEDNVNRALVAPKETIACKMIDRIANLTLLEGLELNFVEKTYLNETEYMLDNFEYKAKKCGYFDIWNTLKERVEVIKSIF